MKEGRCRAVPSFRGAARETSPGARDRQASRPGELRAESWQPSLPGLPRDTERKERVRRGRACRALKRAGPRHRARRFPRRRSADARSSEKASVDFPLPFGPIRAWTFPGSTVRSIPLRISLPATRQRKLEMWRPVCGMRFIVAEPLLESQGKTLLSRGVRARIAR